MFSRFKFVWGALVALSVCLPGCGDESAVAPEADTLTASTTDVQTSAADAPTLLAVGATSTTGAVAVTGTWAADTQHIAVEVAVSQFKDLFGIAGHLHYDPAVLQLVASKAIGVPLGKAGKPLGYTPKAVLRDSPVGRLLVGGARVINAPSPYEGVEGVAVDREVWLQLEFAVLQKKPTQVAFDPTTLVAKTGTYTDIQADWGHLEISWPQPVVGGAP